jgi:lipoprotein-releasing system permease protein
MVMRIFFLTGASIGVMGATAGVILGVLFVQNIERLRHWIQAITGTDVFAAALYIFTEIPATLDWGQVTAIVIMALGLSFAFSIFPAWRASRIDPVEALRYE